MSAISRIEQSLGLPLLPELRALYEHADGEPEQEDPLRRSL
jgi:cell wall assembly regulator SMI1